MKPLDPSQALLEPAPPGTNAHRSNGFDVLRLLAAVAVIYGHSFYLAGVGGGVGEPGYLGCPLATLAVKVFFITSGFLVAQSWMADPRVYAFAMRRTLRIMPALICAVLLTILVLGPIFTGLSFGKYITHPETWAYLWNIAFCPVYSMPGVFEHNLYPNAINGSLWTIPVEVFMYLTVPPLLWRNPQLSRVALLIATVLLAVFAVYYVQAAPITPRIVIWGNSFSDGLQMTPYFLIGSLYAVFGLQRFSRPVLSIALLVIAAQTIQTFILCECVLLVLLPFAVISIGMLHFPIIDKPMAWGDFSYGIYLYGFPIQQVCMALSNNRLTAMENFIISLPIVVVVAMLSWFLIERTALTFKPRRASKLSRS